MGGGVYTTNSFADYSRSVGKIFSASTGRVSGQVFTTNRLKEVMNPKGVIRECANSKEHPNTIPVILGLDVTGSMGSACKETAEALNVIMTKLYEKFKDIEFCIMGIGDFECDDAPLQVSQFESDVRIAQAIDNLYMEHGGGGNGYESYTAPWYFGLHNTKLDAYDEQDRKGIIITMGDEPLNPDLPKDYFKGYLGLKEVGSLETKKLYKEASEKFDIYHISINDSACNYDDPKDSYAKEVDESFIKVIGKDAYKVSTIDNLSKTIVECISNSLQSSGKAKTQASVQKNDNGEIVW